MSMLERGLLELGITASKDQLEKLNIYVDEIEVWNGKYNLVKVAGREEILTRHVLDSLAGLPHIRAKNPRSLADLGSGAGFPGIPLALFLTECAVVLVERSEKRCRFLEQAKLLLDLKNVRVLNRDSSEVGESFDLVTFRAFRPFEEAIVADILGLLNPGGWTVAYKGRFDKTEEERQGLEDRFVSTELIPLKVPFSEGERHLLMLRG